MLCSGRKTSTRFSQCRNFFFSTAGVKCSVAAVKLLPEIHIGVEFISFTTAGVKCCVAAVKLLLVFHISVELISFTIAGGKCCVAAVKLLPFFTLV